MHGRLGNHITRRFLGRAVAQRAPSVGPARRRAPCAHWAPLPPVALALLVLAHATTPAHADFKPIPLSPTALANGATISTDQAIDFVTVTNINGIANTPWPGNGIFGDRTIGHGSVGYDYKIGRFEVTTAQWVEFFNAAYDRPSNDRIPFLSPPGHWGATGTTPTTPGGRRWSVPAGNEMIPVGNISWRMAAIYCNWLHNNKSADRSAFLNGAYDTSTFGYSGTTFTDQLTHNPGARYWIPTWDEWLKAAHYDANKLGASEGGTGVSQWWNYSITSDAAPVYGAPGTKVNGQLAQANSGTAILSPFTISLGAYPTVQSPWGLLDTAGGTSEWSERTAPPFTDRGFFGTAWAFAASPVDDAVRAGTGDFPSLNTYDLGFRIAGAPVPGPTCSLVVGLGALAILRRHRHHSPAGAPPLRGHDVRTT